MCEDNKQWCSRCMYDQKSERIYWCELLEFPSKFQMEQDPKIEFKIFTKKRGNLGAVLTHNIEYSPGDSTEEKVQKFNKEFKVNEQIIGRLYYGIKVQKVYD